MRIFLSGLKIINKKGKKFLGFKNSWGLKILTGLKFFRVGKHFRVREFLGLHNILFVFLQNFWIRKSRTLPILLWYLLTRWKLSKNIFAKILPSTTILIRPFGKRSKILAMTGWNSKNEKSRMFSKNATSTPIFVTLK